MMTNFKKIPLIFSSLLIGILAVKDGDKIAEASSGHIHMYPKGGGGIPMEVSEPHLIPLQESKESSESSEYAAAVSSSLTHERTTPATTSDEEHRNQIQIKVGNKTKKSKTSFTLENLKKKGYAIESWDKETGIVTLRAKNKTSDNGQQSPPPGSVKKVAVTPGMGTKDLKDAKVVKEPNSKKSPSKPNLSSEGNASVTTHSENSGPSSPASEVVKRVATATATTTTKIPTPRPNYKTTTELGQTPAKIPEVPKPPMKEHLQKCPAFKDFVNGSSEMWNSLKNSQRFSDGFSVLVDAAINSFDSITHCVTKVISDIGSWFVKLPSDISEFFSNASFGPANSTVVPDRKVEYSQTDMSKEREKFISAYQNQMKANSEGSRKEMKNEPDAGKKEDPSIAIKRPQEAGDRKGENPPDSTSRKGNTKEKLDVDVQSDR